MIGKISGQYGIGSAAKANAKKGYDAAGRNETDEASFSLFSLELARASSELKNAPEVRQNLVDGFRQKVEAGEYHPPLEKVAHSLFLAGILNRGD